MNSIIHGTVISNCWIKRDVQGQSSPVIRPRLQPPRKEAERRILIDFNPELEILSQADHGGRLPVPASDDAHAHSGGGGGVGHDVGAGGLEGNTEEGRTYMDMTIHY